MSDRPSQHREQVEDAANRIREDLMVTLAELDRRRDQALDPRYQVQKHLPLLLGIAGGITALAAVVGGVAVYRAMHRDERRRAERREALRRAWRHPERLATRAKQRPAPAELGRKVAVAFGIALGTQLAKRAALRMVPSPMPKREPLRRAGRAPGRRPLSRAASDPRRAVPRTFSRGLPEASRVPISRTRYRPGPRARVRAVVLRPADPDYASAAGRTPSWRARSASWVRFSWPSLR